MIPGYKASVLHSATVNLSDLIAVLEDLGLEVKHNEIDPEAWGNRYWFRVKRPEPTPEGRTHEHYMIA